MSRFKFDWVLINELAVGSAPLTERHLNRLKDNGISSILSLCSIKEAAQLDSMQEKFQCERIILPDHRSGRKLEEEEFLNAVDKVAKLRAHGSVFVHCFAGVERSPIVCMGWLVRQHGLSPQGALDYLMQVHPGTNPLPSHLDILRRTQFSKNN
tara:strand:- start:6731 stop:7192 length:462 start_codon:yes stop_codon:yes gene_type:complete